VRAKLGAVTFTDSFNRANGALGANWTAVGTAPVIVSNKATPTANSTECQAMWSAPVSGASGRYVQAVCTPNSGTNSFLGVLLMTSTAGTDGYHAQISGSGTRVALYRRTGGASTLIGSDGTQTITNGVGYLVKITRASNGDIVVTVDGSTRISVNDTTHSPSYAGIQAYTGGVSTLDTVDDFEAGTF
jgi:hypothetical protein